MWWLPIIGPIISGVVDIWKSKTDLQGKLDLNDLEEVKARLALISDQKNDAMFGFLRDLALVPGVLWIFLYGMGKICEVRYPSLVFPVGEFKGMMMYYPLICMAVLFGLNIRKLFK